MSNSLSMYVVYDKTTKDYPGEYVCRRHEITPGVAAPKELVGRAATLEEIRDMIPEGCHRLPRHPSDDPVILETWV